MRRFGRLTQLGREMADLKAARPDAWSFGEEMAGIAFESFVTSPDRPRTRDAIAAIVQELTPGVVEMAVRANPAWAKVSADGYLDVDPIAYKALAISYGTKLTDLLSET
jgi:hypothetical protein